MPDPDERPPAPRQLDKAPGERYRGARPPSGPVTATAARPAAAVTLEAASGSARRGILAALSVAVVAAVARALVGQVDLGPATLVIAAFVGWLVALALLWGAGGRRVER